MEDIDFNPRVMRYCLTVVYNRGKSYGLMFSNYEDLMSYVDEIKDNLNMSVFYIFKETRTYVKTLHGGSVQ